MYRFTEKVANAGIIWPDYIGTWSEIMKTGQRTEWFKKYADRSWVSTLVYFVALHPSQQLWSYGDGQIN